MDIYFMGWAICNQGLFLRVVFSNGLSTVYMLYSQTTFWLYSLCVALLLFGCISEPDYKSTDYIKLHTSLPSENIVASRANQALKKILENSSSSISCTFSNLEVTLPYFNGSQQLTEQENYNFEILQTLLRKKTEGKKVEVILSKQEKCHSTGTLLLEYPFLAKNDHAIIDTNLSSLLAHCNQTLSEPVLNSLLSLEKQSGFQNSKNIHYVNKEGRVKQNSCVIDGKLVFVASGGPAVSRTENTGAYGDKFENLSIALELHSEKLASTFLNEHNRLKNGLSGKWKSVTSNGNQLQIQDVSIKTIWGPQEKPLKYLEQAINKYSTIQFLSEHMEVISFTSGKVNEAILNKVQNGQTIQPSYFSNKGALDEDSAYNAIFNTALPCGVNTPRCPKNIQLLKSHFNHEKAGGVSLFLLSNENNLNNNNYEILTYFGSISNESNYDDSLLLSLHSKAIYIELQEFLNSLKDDSYNPGFESNNGSAQGIVINEILWMGSIDNKDNRHPTDEFIELYNTTTTDINISSWKIACTTDPGGLSASTIIIFPQGSRISANGFITVSKTRGFAIHNSDIISSHMSILNGTRECILIDNTPGQPEDYSHYQNSSLNGKIIDQVLSCSGDAWNLTAANYYSRTGLNTLKHNHGADGVRSMERIDPVTSGIDISNWKTNVSFDYSNIDLSNPPFNFIFPGINNNITVEYQARTRATPNFANSQSPVNTVSEDIKITEFNWMGSYDNSGVSHPEDEFIELYNNSSEPSYIGGWTFGCTTSANADTGKPAFAIPYGELLKPGQYYVVSRSSAGAIPDAQYVNNDMSMANNTRSCVLTNGNPSSTLYVGSDSSDANTTLDGHYDNPLFLGTVKDNISTELNTLSNAQIGINDTTNKIRRSAERKWPIQDGTIDSSWGSNSFTIIENIFLPLEFQQNTYATPGAPNSALLGW